MTATVLFPDFYRGAINLWVEDPLTRDYLRKVWQDDPSIMFYVGGGNEGVSAILKEAEVAGLSNVFAIIDRDFGVTNRPDWNNPAKTSRRFVSSVHEVENHLLDFTALAGCSLNTGGRIPKDIEARLRKRASELAWWMATRSVISEVRQNTLQNFPAHPTCPAVVDQATAFDYLQGLDWWKTIQAYASSLTPANLQNWLESQHAAAVARIDDGSWLVEFPGKELFRHIRDWVYTEPPKAAPATLLDADLAKAVGEWQAANDRAPQELTDLLIALKTRAGIL